MHQIKTVTDIRHLFQRALSNKAEYANRTRGDHTWLDDRTHEYGSIVSTVKPSEEVKLSSQETSTRDNNRAEANKIPPQTLNTKVSNNAVFDLSIPDLSETLSVDEENWRMNDSLLGQHYLTSFMMGNELGMFGDEHDLYMDDPRFSQ